MQAGEFEINHERLRLYSHVGGAPSKRRQSLCDHSQLVRIGQFRAPLPNIMDCSLSLPIHRWRLGFWWESEGE